MSEDDSTLTGRNRSPCAHESVPTLRAINGPRSRKVQTCRFTTLCLGRFMSHTFPFIASCRQWRARPATAWCVFFPVGGAGDLRLARTPLTRFRFKNHYAIILPHNNQIDEKIRNREDNCWGRSIELFHSRLGTGPYWERYFDADRIWEFLGDGIWPEGCPWKFFNYTVTYLLMLYYTRVGEKTATATGLPRIFYAEFLINSSDRDSN